MSQIVDQYDAYPYPERDPADEAKRLVTGSPSNPVEIDHVLYKGNRDWSEPFRAIVAGGGTGDALIQLATMLTIAKKPYDITYLDLSPGARKIAEARAAARGLQNIRFETDSLLNAPDYGPVDYIDCCGVLHHLPDPGAGLRALHAALKPDGGLGWMVYAPYGRGGVYPLQEAFGALFDGLSPQDKLKKAKALMPKLPDGHPFKLNPHVVDHKISDAGFYDLLLHSQDRAYRIDEWGSLLDDTGFDLVALGPDALYDLGRITEVPAGMDRLTQMATAERLHGAIRKHLGYARPKGAAARKGAGMDAVPHMTVDPRKIAQAVAQGKPLPITSQNVKLTVPKLPKQAAKLIAGIDRKRTLADIAKGAGMQQMAFLNVWGQIEAAFEPVGLLLYSRILAP